MKTIGTFLGSNQDYTQINCFAKASKAITAVKTVSLFSTLDSKCISFEQDQAPSTFTSFAEHDRLTNEAIATLEAYKCHHAYVPFDENPFSVKAFERHFTIYFSSINLGATKASSSTYEGS